MYKCEVCTSVSNSGDMLQRFAVMRERKCTKPERMADGRMTIVAATRPEIAAEIKVCKECKHALEAGIPLHQLRKNYERYTTVHQVEPDTKTAEKLKALGLEVLQYVGTTKQTTAPLKPMITPESRVASVANMGKSAS